MTTDLERAQGPAPAGGGRDRWVRAAAVAIALGAWAALTFGHGQGLRVAAGLFAWAKEPGVFTEQGGPAGLRVLERRMTVVFALIAVAVIARLAWALRRTPWRQVLREGAPWVAWAGLVVLIRKLFIVYATEFVHFAQYALVGALVCWAIDRGRRPVVAFLATVALGALDEVWQHYGLHAGEKYHWMDWSDIVLDALGAAGGILPYVTLARLRGERLPDTRRAARTAVAAAACLLLPLLLLDPVTQSWLLGHYIYWPVWGEYENDKPTHWPGPLQGIPLVLASLVVLTTLLEPRRRALSQAGVAVLVVLALVAADPPSRKRGTPVHEVVRTVRAPRAAGPITVDGLLDEPAWASAPLLELRRNLDGEAPREGRTGARVLWDDEALYVAFACEDRDVWARATHRDDRTLPGDEVVEVFLDDGGDEVTYLEVEVSPAGVVYDLFNFVPQAPVDYDPDQKFIGLPGWDWVGLEAAVRVDGTLDVVDAGTTPRPQDADRGWTVELRLPWSALRTTTTPGQHSKWHLPPRPGQRWRLGLYRVERPRPAPAADPDARVPADEARALVVGHLPPDRAAKRWAELEGGLSPAPDGTLRAADVARAAAQERAEYTAWSPTWNAQFHRPQYFGVLEFGE